MNKKRVLAMLLAGAMALSMTACGGGNSASTDGIVDDRMRRRQFCLDRWQQ